MSLADYTGSDVPSGGVIRDLAVAAGGYDSSDISYRLEAHTPAALVVGIYLDGDLVGRQQASEIVGSVAGITEGDHTLDVVPLPIGQPLYSRHGNSNGGRVYLRWSPSPSSDCASYRIYRDGTLIDTVTELVVSPLEYYRTSGGGRISVHGRPSLVDQVNRTFALTIVSPGVAEFEGLQYTFQPGLTLSLPFGIKLTFHDAIDSYGSCSVIFAGVRFDYLTDALEPGTYVFTVRGYDRAGNESGTVLTRSVKVLAVPPAVTVTDNDISGDEALIAEVRIYSDYCVATGEIGGHIEERFPVGTLTHDGSSFGIPALPVGARYYARPYKDGVERDDLTIYRMVDLAAPVLTWGALGDVSLAAAAAGDMLLRFNYRAAEEDSAAGFRVEWGLSAGALGSVVLVALSAGTGFPLRAFSVALDASAATGAAIYARVTPEDALGNLGTASAVVSAVADATAPTMSGTLGAVAT